MSVYLVNRLLFAVEEISSVVQFEAENPDDVR